MWKANSFFFVLNKSTFEFEQYFLDMFKQIMFMFVILSVEKVEHSYGLKGHPSEKSALD